MKSQQAVRDTIEVEINDIGGIDESHVTFDPGVTVLAGRNATNRTSLLQAISTALGSDKATLKADAGEGSVTLTIDDETYARGLQRENGTVVMDGDPYLDDPEVADLFAFLLAENEARQAVERNEDLRELIMRPVDTEAIQEEIEELTNEKRQVESELNELAELKDRVPELEDTRTQLVEEIEEKKDELAAKEEEIRAADESVEATREAKADLDEELDKLRETRSDLEDVRYELETERESLDSLRAEVDQLEAELDELPETPQGDIEEIDTRLDSLRDRKQTLSSDVSQLQNIIQFNEEMLDGTEPELFEKLTDEGSSESSDSPTDKLLEGSEAITCWTCGSSIEKSQVETILNQLRELTRSKREKRNDIDGELDELKERKRELDQQQRLREKVERRLRQHNNEIEQTNATIDDLESRREELSEEIGDLEETVQELEEQNYNEVLELHKEANQIEFDIDRLEDQLQEAKREIESIHSRLNRRDDLEDELAEVQSRLDDLRTEIDRIEERAIEEFNEHMDALLTELEYRNIERVWIERMEQNVQQRGRKASQPVFELHLVRKTESGRVFEDTIHHLSESEREVVGIVFALAGYLTHEVHKTLPFMLLDSLEALDSNRIATLIDYLRQYVDNIVVALLPDDAEPLHEEFNYVTSI